MKRIINSIAFRLCLTLALFTTLVIHPQLSASRTLVAPQEGQIKSESQLRSEAARYESAIRAIGDIASMKIENPDEMKRALALIDREGPNLKLLRSKLMLMGITDTTFSDSVKKVGPNKGAAEALAKEWKADPKTVLKLNGAQALATKLEQAARADLAIVERTAEHLKAASEKFKRAGAVKPGAGLANPYAALVPVGYKAGDGAFGEASNYPVPPTQVEIALMVVGVVILAALFLFFTVYGLALMADYFKLFLGDKETEDCLNAAKRKDEACVADASKLIPPLDFAAKLECAGQYALDQMVCAL